MQTKTWTMKEGFLAGGSLVVIGLLLQLCVGPVMWDVFAWPVNGIALAGFLSVVAAVFLLRARVRFFRFIGTYQAAIPSLVYAVLLTVMMGLIRQTPTAPPIPAEGSMWLNSMLTFWPFVLIYAYMAVILGVTVLQRLSKMHLRRSRHDIPFLLNHLGLFIVMTTATLGNADLQRLKMITVVGEPERRAMSQEGLIHEMPMAIELKEFTFETYNNGSPKRFASDLQITTMDDRRQTLSTDSAKSFRCTVEVNKPAEVSGWKIYQYGYDTQMGAMSRISILELVSDPWLPVVYTGIYMMLAGAVCMFLLRCRWWFIGILALVFICLFLLWPHMHSEIVMPALQSPWFAPHVIVYMIAYTLLGVATLMALYALCSPQSALHTHIDPIVYAGVAFMTVGMLFGALWAKEAWGHYWSWDPKETWAAITWFAYLIYIHYHRQPSRHTRTALLMLIVSFLLLQMCWWGINYLPSAQGVSVHTYN